MRTTPRRILLALTSLALAAPAAGALATGPGAVAAPTSAFALSGRDVTGPDDSPGTTLLGRFGAATGSPRAWATRALAARADRLGVDADAVRWEQVRHSVIGTHVRGREYRDGVPVRGTDVLVTAVDGRIVEVAGSGSALPGRPVADPVPVATARTAALAALGVTGTLVEPAVTRELRAVDGRLVDTFAVSVVGTVPAVAGEVVVAAADGRVLGVADDARYGAQHHPTHDGGRARAQGESFEARLFDPNPVVTARDTTLRTPAETGTGANVVVDDPALTEQMLPRTLRHLDPASLQAGLLSGPWADLPAPVGFVDQQLGEPVTYSRSDPRFLGAMAYYHVDTYQSWLQRLGIRDVNAEPQTIVPTPVQGFDNSFYQPGNDLILFGGGGIPDAEDADVVLHEYGHAMQDDQVPGYGETDAGGAMGEGFGDFNAANYFALTSGGFHDECVADWDATTYSTDDPTCLRRLDSTKNALDDLEGEVHADGEIWSAYLWRVRAQLGRTTRERSVNGIRLVLGMHETLLPDAEYADAVRGLVVAAKALGKPRWVPVITREARRSGYLS